MIDAFIMQIGVQGPWGIIPAYLNELSPSAVGRLMPGVDRYRNRLGASRLRNRDHPRTISICSLNRFGAEGQEVSAGTLRSRRYAEAKQDST